MGCGLASVAALALLMTQPVITDSAQANERRRGGAPPTIADLPRDGSALSAVSGSGALTIDRRVAMDNAITSYEQFLELPAGDQVLRRQAMRRLADLKLERAEQADIDAETGPARTAMNADLDDAIALYLILNDDPSDDEHDAQVLYQLARAYEIRGETDAMLGTLADLVARHPSAAFSDEAEFRRGESLFVARRYGEAGDAYAAVLARGEQSAYYDQSLYKHGWALFRQMMHEDALGSFFTLLDRRLTVRDVDASVGSVDEDTLYEQMTRAERELMDDTLRVVALTFAQLAGADALTAYLATYGRRPYGHILYATLGALYLEQERYQDAADTFGAFAYVEPDHARAPLLQTAAIDAYRDGGFAELVLDAQRAFVERYGAGSSYWQRHTFQSQPEVAQHLRDHLGSLAAHHHAMAQAHGDLQEFALAARWYRGYLDSFPDDADAPAKNFLLAEVLFESGRYQEAAREYERTAYAYAYEDLPGQTPGAEAGYAALLAYARHEAELSGAARDAWHREGIDSALRFASTWPSHQQARMVETDAAEKLFALGEYASARDVAWTVLQRVPSATPPLQRTAWSVVAYAEFDLGNYAGSEQAYQSLLPLLADDPERFGEATESLAAAIYRQGEQARDAGDADQAVGHFLRVADTAPRSGVRAVAEYDAAAVLVEEGDWQRAATVLEGFRSRFPDHTLAADVSATLAVAYVETGDHARAATEFERIAAQDPDPDVRREALLNAAELYSESGNTSRAALVYGQFVEQFPTPVAASMEIRSRLAQIAADEGDAATQAHWLREIVTADAMAGEERSARTRYLAANAQLFLAEPVRDAFLAVRLVAPLADSLRLKRTRMEQALTAYTSAADYGIAAVTTAATYEIAELYHELARALLTSEKPADLDADELEQYEILLEEQAFPFEEEAIALHERNAARTAEGVYDQWIAKSIAQLAGLLPVRYAKVEQGQSFVDAAEGMDESALRNYEAAVAAMRDGRQLEAAIWLETLIESHPDLPGALVNLAILYRDDGRTTDANDMLRRALAAEPAHIPALNMFGVVLREQGRFDEAEHAYRDALQADADFALAHYNLAVLLDLYLHRPVEALEHYRQYQSLLPEPDPMVARWITDLGRRFDVVAEEARVARGEAI